MAYAAVASLSHTIDLLLEYHQHSISPRFKTQIISIHQHTCSLESFIESSSSRVNNWEETIRDVTTKAEDIIELLLSDSLLKSTVGSSKSEVEKGKYEVGYSFDELERVTEEMESIVDKVRARLRMKTVDVSNEEVMEIISLLRGGSAALEVIAICGVGGTGKATLARNAWFHPLIHEEHFDVRLRTTRADTWVVVIRELLRSMGVEFSVTSEDELLVTLLHNLGRRRYIIFLDDDVWSKDVLERLKMMLPDYGNGSRIMFTTRSSDLAKSAHHIHEMSLLDEDHSWNMLRENIFKGDPCPFQLESIGKMIARICGGHLLSIELVSGILLASDPTEAAWEDVADNMEKIVGSDSELGDRVYRIVYLSYIYLPHHLRPCFLYLGLFPEECYIRVSRLIKLLVAEGFVNESGYKSLEETGQEYVEDLFRRRLVSVHRRKSNGRIRSIEVHYLIRYVCLREAHIENFNLHCDSPPLKVNEIMMSCRRVSTLFFSDELLRGVYGSTIRSLVLYLEIEHGILDLSGWIENIQLLRILDLLAVGSYRLFDGIFELFHLRYLAFDCDSNIPKAISNLENLQTLFIFHDQGGVFDHLPEEIWRLPRLRYLYLIRFKFPNGKELTSAPQENLQALSKVVDLVCSKEILEMIPNLKKLDLIYTMKLTDVVENYELHNLMYLQKLEHLKLETHFSVGEEHRMSCAFPPTLKKLSLRGLQLSWEDMKIVASLPHLEMLKLRNHACVGDTWETSEGGFSRLSILLIEESNLENWITESSHFPRLSRLVLRRCSSRLEVPYEMAKIPTLRQILVDQTNDSLSRSVERITSLWSKEALPEKNRGERLKDNDGGRVLLEFHPDLGKENEWVYENGEGMLEFHLDLGKEKEFFHENGEGVLEFDLDLWKERFHEKGKGVGEDDLGRTRGGPGFNGDEE